MICIAYIGILSQLAVSIQGEPSLVEVDRIFTLMRYSQAGKWAAPSALVPLREDSEYREFRTNLGTIGFRNGTNALYMVDLVNKSAQLAKPFTKEDAANRFSNFLIHFGDSQLLARNITIEERSDQFVARCTFELMGHRSWQGVLALVNKSSGDIDSLQLARRVRPALSGGPAILPAQAKTLAETKLNSLFAETEFQLFVPNSPEWRIGSKNNAAQRQQVNGQYYEYTSAFERQRMLEGYHFLVYLISAKNVREPSKSFLILVDAQVPKVICVTRFPVAN